MLNQKMEKAIVDQINEEFYSAYLYLSMSAYFHGKGLQGFGHWMYVQYQEELTHAQKFFKYVYERDGKITLSGINTPASEWKSVLEVFETTLKHEQHITSCIYRLVDVALEVRDHGSHSFLQWYVNEQVEEEANLRNLIDQLKLMEASKEGLYHLDKQLATRVFVDNTLAPKGKAAP